MNVTGDGMPFRRDRLDSPQKTYRTAAMGPEEGALVLRGAQLVLPAVPRGVLFSRQLVRELCSLLDMGPLAEVAELLTSEVITNAVVHATTESVRVIVEVDGNQLLVSVADSDHHQPAMRHPTAISLGGRGLHLLDSLAEKWGVTEGPTGKAVWFALSSPAATGIDAESGSG